MLNSDSPIPLYLQLAGIIQNRIEKGEFVPGVKISSENELAAKYKIGRPTVRMAFDVLIRKGIIESRRGSGTFVREKPKEISLFGLAGTSAAFSEKGITIEQKIIEPLKLIEIRDSESPFYGFTAYYFSRVSLAGQIPVLFEKITLDPELFSGIEKMALEGQSLARIAEEHFHIRPIGGRQTFGTHFPDKNEAGVLDIDTGSPVLLVKRTVHFKLKTNAIYSEIFCRTDQFVFSQELGGSNE